MSATTILGVRVITHDWMPKGFVAMQNGEPWPDTHTVILTPEGKVLDMGRPRDLFPVRWEYRPMDEPPYRKNWFIS